MGTTTQLSLPMAFHMSPAVHAACTSACLSSPANDTAAGKLHSLQPDDCIARMKANANTRPAQLERCFKATRRKTRLGTRQMCSGGQGAK